MRSLITGPRLFTGLDHTFIDRGAVLVERDRIVAAGRESEIGALDGPVQRFHIPDGTIVPGLIDGHTHSPAAPATAWWRTRSKTTI